MSLQFQGKHTQGKQVIAFALLFNTFSWYFIGYLIVNKLGFEGMLLKLAYPSSIIISGIVGSLLAKKVRKKRFLYAWLIIGIMASLCSTIPQDSLLFTKFIVTIFLGSSLGVGMPLCLSFFTELTPVENRGRIGGLVFFATALSAPFLSIITPELNLMSGAIVCAVWRGWGLLLLYFAPRKTEHLEIDNRRTQSYTMVLNNRTLLLYFAAWLMFTLVDGFGSTIVSVHIEKNYSLIKFVEPAVASFSALVSGMLSDLIGRKKVITFGFVSLGVGYATLGLTPQFWFSWVFYFIVDGLATGSLWVMFTIVIWGEIATHNIEKHYAIGETPYFLTGIVSSILVPYTVIIPETSAFSLAAFFLFVAVIPLMFAPETLPEKKIKERELKKYIEKAKKVREKYD